MNIFILDKDPHLAAQYHCDKHVVKMVLETAQIVSTVNWLKGNKAPYKKTHENHPCVQWAAQSTTNYWWSIQLGLALAAEYTHRYGKVHKSQKVIEWAAEQLLWFDRLDMTPFVLAMPDKYKTECPVESYRRYYIDKPISMVYTKRIEPAWRLKNDS